MLPVSTSLLAENLDLCLSGSGSSGQVISDQYNTFTDSEIVKIFTGLTQLFSKIGVSKDDCCGIECDNSVLNAVIILYFMSEGYSCVLLPPKVSSIERSLLPSFCHYCLKLTDRVEGSEGWQKLDRCLQIVENESWVAPSFPLKSSLCLKTSGSTGSPKLVVHTHESLLRNAQNCVQRLGLQSSDRVTIPVPIYHMYGLGAAFLPSILVGASIDFQRDTNLIKYLEREREFNPNIAFMTPSFCNTLLKGRRASRDYRFTVVAGDRLREDTFWHYESRFGRIVPLYGSTEMGAIAAASPEDSSEIRAKTVGQPMAEVALRVESGSMQADDALMDAGELWCQHRWGFAGYLDEAGHSIGAFTPIEWFQTKDWGRIDPEGNLDILGRCDHSVNRDGLLVFFADLERAMATIPGVETAVVVSGGEVLRGKELVAYCLVASGQALTSDAIRMACFEVLPKRSVPDRIVILDALPLLPSGKVDRQAVGRMG